MFAAGGSLAAFAASGAASDGFLDSWASGLSRDPARGRAWDTTGPGITDDAATRQQVTIANGDAAPVTAAAYTNALDALFISADLVHVSGSGHVRLSDGHLDTTELADDLFCVRSGGCACPDGSEPPVPPAPLRPDAVLAVTGGTAGSNATITGLALEDFCRRHQGAVWVHVERAASNVAGNEVLAGRVFDLVACDGPYGTWTGTLTAGGIRTGAGDVIAWTPVPLRFTVEGTGVQTVHVTVPPTPVDAFVISWELDISVDGKTMSITGTGRGDYGAGTVDVRLPAPLTGLPIEPAPPDRCPA
jgi:hypothetical protein